MASCPGCTRLPGFLVATSSSMAAWPMPTAVVAEDARRFYTGGTSGAPGALTSTCPATASAAVVLVPIGTWLLAIVLS